MSVNTTITFGPHYHPGGDFSMRRLGLRVGVIDNRYTSTASNRYLLVRSKTDLSSIMPNINSLPNDDPWDNSLYIMAGLVTYHIYEDIAHIQNQDNLDVLYLKPNMSGFIALYNTCAMWGSLTNTITVSNIDNLGYADLSLYAPTSIHRYSALFYGYTFSATTGKIYLSTEFILALQRHMNDEKIFCGLIAKLTGRYARPSTSIINHLIANKVNIAGNRALINPYTLDRKLIHHVITNTWIRNKIVDIMLSYRGRQNDPGLWDEARTELEAFGNYLSSVPCGPINFRVLMDETNNSILSDTLHAEIQYFGATTDGFQDVQSIELNVRIT